MGFKKTEKKETEKKNAAIILQGEELQLCGAPGFTVLNLTHQNQLVHIVQCLALLPARRNMKHEM